MAHNLVLMTLTLKSTRTLAVFILRLVAKLYSENAAPYKNFFCLFQNDAARRANFVKGTGDAFRKFSLRTGLSALNGFHNLNLEHISLQRHNGSPDQRIRPD